VNSVSINAISLSHVSETGFISLASSIAMILQRVLYVACNCRQFSDQKRIPNFRHHAIAMELVLPLLEEVSHCSSHTNANEIPVTFQRQKVHNHQSHDSYYYQYSTKHL